MLICDHCGKNINWERFISIIYINIIRGEIFYYKPGYYFHTKCFHKNFIYRTDNNNANKCTCGEFASYNSDGLFIECLCYKNNFGHINTKAVYYYHKDCFEKYWVGRKI